MIGTQDRKSDVSAPVGPAATDLGAMLRDVRVSRGVTLRDAASSLRIRIAYLEAIEAGRFKDLPGATYASGFLRSYASYLGVDGDDVVNRFKAALDGLKRPTNLVLPSPAETGHMPTGSVFLVAAVIAIAAYGGWYYLSVEGRDPGEFLAGVPQRIAGLLSTGPAKEAVQAPAPTPSTSSATDAATVPPAVASAAPEPATAVSPVPPQPESTLPTEPPAPSSTVPAPDRAAPGAAAPPAPPMVAPAPSPSPASTPAAPTPTPVSPGLASAVPASSGETTPLAVSAQPPPTATAAGRIVLRATADSWVELRAPGQSPIVSRILKRGEIYEVPARDDLVLTTGNAGGLEISLDGKTLPPLGPMGAVQRGFALNPDKLAAVNR